MYSMSRNEPRDIRTFQDGQLPTVPIVPNKCRVAGLLPLNKVAIVNGDLRIFSMIISFTLSLLPSPGNYTDRISAHLCQGKAQVRRTTFRAIDYEPVFGFWTTCIMAWVTFECGQIDKCHNTGNICVRISTSLMVL